MSLTQEAFYGGSEELALTANGTANPAQRVHVVTSLDANRDFTLPSATLYRKGSAVQVVFNYDATYTLTVKDAGGSTLISLPPEYGCICDLLANTTDAGSWTAMRMPCDSGPNPGLPINGFIMGGYSPFSSDDHRQFNPRLDSWTDYADSIPTVGFHSGASTFVVGTKAYLTAQISSTKYLYELDPVNTWTARTAPNRFEKYGSSNGANDGSSNNGYLFGGDDYYTKEKMEVYSAPPTDSWAYGTDDPNDYGWFMSSAATVSDVIYFSGGRVDSSGGYFSQHHQAYAPGPIPDTWTSKLDIPIDGRGKHSYDEADGYAFLVGGQYHTYIGTYGNRTKDWCQRYDPGTDSWSFRAEFPPNRVTEHPSFTLYDVLFVAGGHQYDGVSSDDSTPPDTYGYDNTEDTWTQYADMATGVDRAYNQGQPIQV